MAAEGLIHGVLATGGRPGEALDAALEAGIPFQEAARLCVGAVLAGPLERAWAIYEVCVLLAVHLLGDPDGKTCGPSPAIAQAIGAVLDEVGIPRQSLIEITTLNWDTEPFSLELREDLGAALGLAQFDSIPGWGALGANHTLEWGEGMGWEGFPTLPEGLCCGSVMVSATPDGKVLVLPDHLWVGELEVKAGAQVVFGQGTVVGKLRASGATLGHLERLRSVDAIDLKDCDVEGALAVAPWPLFARTWRKPGGPNGPVIRHLNLERTRLSGGIRDAEVLDLSINGGSVPELGDGVRVHDSLQVRNCAGLRRIGGELVPGADHFEIAACPDLVAFETRMGGVDFATVRGCPKLKAMPAFSARHKAEIEACPLLVIGSG
jgi:hypothetical protein